MKKTGMRNKGCEPNGNAGCFSCMPLVVDRYNWPQVPYDMRQHVSLEERQRATSSRQERATPKEHRGAAEEQRGFPSAVQHATCFSLFLAEHNLPFIFAMTCS
ncbi:uncharacterized protein [Penaeus vannamei]|uniref:uncharacterized protein n=1 Tax=Penaeus vannamei TaxID=6689 RepID=UPI00387FAE74